MKSCKVLSEAEDMLYNEFRKFKKYLDEKRVYHDYLSELNLWKVTQEGKEFMAEHTEFGERQKAFSL